MSDRAKKPYEPWNYAREEAVWRAQECRRGLEEYFKKRDAREAEILKLLRSTSTTASREGSK